jgi:hypothetical protein
MVAGDHLGLGKILCKLDFGNDVPSRILAHGDLHLDSASLAQATLVFAQQQATRYQDLDASIQAVETQQMLEPQLVQQNFDCSRIAMHRAIARRRRARPELYFQSLMSWADC